MLREFEISEEQEKKLLEAMKPVPLIALQCGMPRSQQENANEAWKAIGREMGFDGMTVQPSGKGMRFILAEEVTK